VEPADTVRAVFFGLGADGTVGANKNSIKIIAEDGEPARAGLLRLRLEEVGGDHDLAPAVRAAADSRAVPDHAGVVRRLPPVQLPRALRRPRLRAARGRVPAERAASACDQIWDELPFEIQEQIVEKRLRFFVIDAYAVAQGTGMGTRINTIMQTCFFAISGVLPRDQAIAEIKHAIEKTYAKRGDAVVQRNYEAVDATLAHLHEVAVPASPTASYRTPPLIPGHAPDFVQRVTAVMLANQGDRLPGQRVPGRRRLADRHVAVGEAQRRHRDPRVGSAPVHPVQQVRDGLPARGHPVKVYDPARMTDAPAMFKGTTYKGPTSPATTPCRSRPRTAPAARSA
jgi:pyruvate-ferredoxin/flavodoxin oxidoreductase